MSIKEYFPGIDNIKYEGPGTENHLAFRYYDEDYEIAGKTMKDHFRFAMATGIACVMPGPILLDREQEFFHGMYLLIL